MKFSSSIICAIAAALISNVDAITSQYTPFEGELADTSFFEQFDLGWRSRWTPSNAMKDNQLSYVGEWKVEESIVLPAIKNDKGLVMKSEAALHAISAKLPQVFNNENNTLVLQYEVKLQNGLDCGGAYIKLLAADDVAGDNGENGAEFSDRTPYVVMFGPDKCGASNKVHFILKTLNEKTGELEEHQLKNPPMAKIVQTTSLYTLIIENNQDFQIRINGDIVRSGNLLDIEDFDLLPPKEIVDINDVKPDDWVETQYIKDPNDVKPDDWDDNAPYLIDDPNSVKPEDWNEDMDEQIPDPSDVKPEDWDDEEDGIWEQKLIDNPECENHGCGKWIRPKIKNPNYRGKWKQKLIPNPEYKGEWEPRLIPNPAYSESNSSPSNLLPIGGLGFEIWTMNSGIMFDNIYLGHDINEAELIGNETFVPKLNAEHEWIIRNDPNVENPINADDKYLQTAILSDMYEYALDNIALFLSDLRLYVADVIEAPIETLLQRPGEAFFFASVIIGTFGTIIGFWTMVINIAASMINSYFEVEKSAYDPKAKPQIPEKVEMEIIDEKEGSSNSKVNETDASKR